MDNLITPDNSGLEETYDFTPFEFIYYDRSQSKHFFFKFCSASNKVPCDMHIFWIHLIW